MGTTCQDILTQAIPRSAKNRGDALADPASELRLVVGRALRTFFTIGARLNPERFGARAEVENLNGVWARPEDADLLYHIEVVESTLEAIVVPYNERAVEVGKPRLIREGSVYRTAGGTGDPVGSDSLLMLYARFAIIPVSLAATLDALWPTAFDGLLVDEVALYLALKDNRIEEMGPVQASRDEWLRLYLAHLEHDTSGVARRFLPEPSGQQGRVPLASLLAGGTEVAVG